MASGIRVLIIDDNSDPGLNLKDILSSKGYKAMFAGDGTSGLGMLKSDKFDIVLMDMQMPTLDGLDTARKIREVAPEIPIIIMTGFISSGRVEAALQIGGIECLQKPLDFDRLFGLINTATVKEGGDTDAYVERM